MVVDVHVVVGDKRLPTGRQLHLMCGKVLQWVVDSRDGRAATLVEVGRLGHVPWLGG